MGIVSRFRREPDLRLLGRVPGVSGIALTFDDGPSEHTPDVLAVLRRYGARATFFVVGDRVAGRERILRQIVAEGHELGNHTLSHVLLTKHVDSAQRELAGASELIRSVAGVSPVLCRPPYGELDHRSAAIVAELGMTPALWDVDPQDWDGAAPAEITERVVSAARPGSIVLLHDGPGGMRRATVDALPGIIERLLARGHASLTLSELLARGLAARWSRRLARRALGRAA